MRKRILRKKSKKIEEKSEKEKDKLELKSNTYLPKE